MNFARIGNFYKEVNFCEIVQNSSLVFVANVVANEQTTALYNYVGGTLNDQLGPWVPGTHMDGDTERNIFFLFARNIQRWIY
jgi:hypothetical protein